ncbi:2-amino-4-hydroxy-6-hydroxymethyldihydropteridine diphosphokinase [Cloacibacillus sp. An23]|uniref:2-amino-4-hydroxy-6- hydroxymethyldihydropteridine diphosphokinase n=1 Tax=Cloacibacillus sp. An23 TaxID=1965591 RepID=UPI000B36B7C2|nr:2-amino-4-hydroxy-6-hydroxymethyldihydropteridine diphosphokinase [Cloacibacillus sp. An23]OUO93979.1 2-amino-4-hydroxy-6-hydroxymethyldihydropteridine diphosphokinase [Cloacibacillus sp. An23]
MSDKRIFLAFGSNLGNRLEHLKAALKYLEEHGVRIESKSRVWETAPWGETDQPAFLNMCASARTDLDPFALLRLLKNAEADLGRRESSHWGPREIDIDIIFFGSLVMNDQKLTIPHPYMHERGFVLKPLSEIAPDEEHPVSHKTVSEMLSELPKAELENMVWISEI